MKLDRTDLVFSIELGMEAFRICAGVFGPPTKVRVRGRDFVGS